MPAPRALRRRGAILAAVRLLEVETFGRGGLIHYAYNLSCALAERGHEVTLVTAAGYELEGHGEPPADLDLVKATARFSQGAGRSWPEPILALVRKLEALADAVTVAALALRLRPDAVHLHSTNPVALVQLALLRLLRLRVVATAHVVTPHEPMRFQRAVYGRIHRLAHLVIAHSEVDRRRLLEELAVDPERVTVIPHGEYGFFARGGESPDRDAARRGLGLGGHDEVALFFGYIRRYKGVDLLLEAWPAVREARPAARLVVAGDPGRLDAASRDELAARARQPGVVRRLEYIPFSEVPRYFAAADVVVMPYRAISQSGVLFLALSLGVPVVATRVGGLPEMLRDGESALLVPPQSPAALAEALVRLLGDPELRARLARGGRLVAAEHSWPAIAERTEAAFAGLLPG